MNRGRLFASIEHVERVSSRGLGDRSGGRPPEHEPPPRRTLTAPAALKTAAERANRAKQAIAMPPPARDLKGTVRFEAKALPARFVLDPAVVATVELRDGGPAPPFLVAVDGHQLRAQCSAKAVRKVLAAIAEHSADRVSVILQGKLLGDVLAEAGIVVQVRQPKAAP